MKGLRRRLRLELRYDCSQNQQKVQWTHIRRFPFNTLPLSTSSNGEVSRKASLYSMLQLLCSQALRHWMLGSSWEEVIISNIAIKRLFSTIPEFNSSTP
jgi:hypothetical protein